jgi:hypothetical protein
MKTNWELFYHRYDPFVLQPADGTSASPVGLFHEVTWNSASHMNSYTHFCLASHLATLFQLFRLSSASSGKTVSHLAGILAANLGVPGTNLMIGEVTVEPATPVSTHNGKLYLLQYPRRAATFLHTTYQLYGE